MGDKVAPGDVLCGIETDKAVVDFEMQEEGYVAKILHSAGAKDVPLGAPVAILVDDPADIKAFEDWQAGDVSAAQEASQPEVAATTQTTSAPASSVQRLASTGDR